MIRGIFVLALLLVVSISVSSGIRTTRPTGREADLQDGLQDHDAWVAQTLTQMKTIKAGMTRGQLLEAFRAEGGISTVTQRTFVSRDCSYFKVDVEFEPAAGRKFDKEGRLTNKADDHDVIVKISRPYLEFTMAD
jgi:hypothetical protein